MKFPFARDLFPPLELTQHTLDDVDVKADAVLTETLESATRLLEHEHGLINEHAWKKLKQFDSGVTLYRERKAGSTSTRARSNTFASRDKSLFATPPPSFLAIGQVLCSLDDLMFGLSTATAEAQRIRSSYAPDGIVDCQLLHHLQEPTPKTPFNYRNLQWLATTAGSVPLTRARDYVVVNEAGIVDSDSVGPRIGYSLRHSIQLDDIQPLEQFKIARGAMSICGVFHEVYPSVVHVYMRMTFEPRARGAVNKSLATAAAMDYATALSRMGQVAQMKKLTTAVRATERSMKCPSSMEATDDDWESNPLANSYGSNATSVASSMANQRRHKHKRDDSCGSCCQSMKAPSTPEEVQDATCALCRQTLCRHCRERKELSFVGRYNRVHRSKYSFCSDCLGHTADRNAAEALVLDLVHEELDDLAKSSPGAMLDRSTAVYKTHEVPGNAYEEWRRRDLCMSNFE